MPSEGDLQTFPRANAAFNEEATKNERVLALVRFCFACISLAGISLNPSEVPHFYARPTYELIGAYVLYSGIVLIALQFGLPRQRLTVVVIHAIDMIGAAALTLLTEGPTTNPSLVLFALTLLAAAYRWGLWETLLTGLLDAVLYGSEVLGATVLGLTSFLDGGFELNRFIARFMYLLLLAVMIGYLGERQKANRLALAGIASATERARLARELHDGVIQALFAIRMRLEMLRLSVPAESPANKELQQNEAHLDREVVNLRTMMFALTPIDVRPNAVAALVHDLVERFEHASGIPTQFVSRGDTRSISPQASHEIARIVQESLVNIHKHSGARNVLVNLSGPNGGWRLVIDDDGRGFDFEGRLTHEVLDRERKGPRVIKERVRMLGGSLTIESKRDSGARLEVTLP